MPREINYKIGVDTQEARTQLMQMQSQITNMVNQSHRAVSNVTPTDTTSLEHARVGQASQNLPSPYGEPFGVGNFKKRAQLEQLQGGYHYSPSFVGAGQAAMGLGSAPTGVPDYQWRQQNQEIFQQRTGDLAERLGIYTAGSALGTAAYFAPEVPGIRGASQAAGHATGSAIRGAGSIAGKIMSPLQKLPGGSAVKGLRSVGAMVGNRLPGLLSKGGPIGIGLAGSMAAFSAVTGGIEDIATQRGFEQELTHISPSFVTSDVNPGLGAGFNMSQRENVSKFLNNVRNNTDLSAGGITSLMRGGTQIGRFNGVQTAQDFKQEFSQLVQEVQEVTDSLRMTLDEGLSTIENMRSMGISSASQMGQVADTIQARAGLAGQTPRKMLNTFNRGAQAFNNMGLNMRAGGQLFTNISASVNNQIKRGDIGPAQVHQMGGANNMINSIAGDLTQSITQGSLGNLLISALGNEGFTGVSSDRLQQLINSGANPSVAMDMATNNLSSPDARSNFTANRQEVASDILSSPISPFLVGAMTKRSLQNSGIDATRANMQVALRNQGISNPEPFLDIAANKENALNSVRQRKRLARREAISNMGGRPRIGLFNPISYAAGRLGEAGSAIGRKFAEAGEAIASQFGAPGISPQYREFNVPDVTRASIRRNRDNIRGLLRGENVTGQFRLPGEGSVFETGMAINTHDPVRQSILAGAGAIAEPLGNLPGLTNSPLARGSDAARDHGLYMWSKSNRHPLFQDVAQNRRRGQELADIRERMRNSEAERAVYGALNRDVDEARRRILSHRGGQQLGNVVEGVLGNWDERVEYNTTLDLANRISNEMYGNKFNAVSEDRQAVLMQELRSQAPKSLRSAMNLGAGNVSGNQALRRAAETRQTVTERLTDMGFGPDQARQVMDVIGGNPRAFESYKQILSSISEGGPGSEQLRNRMTSSVSGIDDEDYTKLMKATWGAVANNDMAVGDLAKKMRGAENLGAQMKQISGTAFSDAMRSELNQMLSQAEIDKSWMGFMAGADEGDVKKLANKLDLSPSGKMKKLVKDEFNLQGNTALTDILASSLGGIEERERTGGIEGAPGSAGGQMKNLNEQVTQLNELAGSIRELAKEIGKLEGA